MRATLLQLHLELASSYGCTSLAGCLLSVPPPPALTCSDVSGGSLAVSVYDGSHAIAEKRNETQRRRRAPPESALLGDSRAPRHHKKGNDKRSQRWATRNGQNKVLRIEPRSAKKPVSACVRLALGRPRVATPRPRWKSDGKVRSRRFSARRHVRKKLNGLRLFEQSAE